MTQNPPAAPDIAIDEAALLDDLLSLLSIPSVSGSPAELEVQDHLATTWRAEGLDVDRWDIDVEGLTRDAEFPGMEVPRAAAVGVTARLAGDGTGRDAAAQRPHRRRPARRPRRLDRRPLRSTPDRGRRGRRASWPAARAT